MPSHFRQLSMHLPSPKHLNLLGAGGQLISSELSEQSGLQSHNLFLLIHVESEQVYSKSVQIFGSAEELILLSSIKSL